MARRVKDAGVRIYRSVREKLSLNKPPARPESGTADSEEIETTTPATPPYANPGPGPRNVPSASAQQWPPKITKSPALTQAPPSPNARTEPSYSADSTDLKLSFTPPSGNGSAAADLAVYMRPPTRWHTKWYTSNPPIPPHLKESPEIRFAGSFGYSDALILVRGVILFSDLSMCWYSVTYGTDSEPVTRWARSRPPPEPMSGRALRQAAKNYGAAVAAFAERAAESGLSTMRDCWDIAHEALLYAASRFEPHDTPMLGTSRTYGHLLFCGKPGAGRWRGGDDRFRAGDIVEWRSVRIGMQSRADAILGDPDHTAVLVEETVPRFAVADGQSVLPADVGVLTVVEQTAEHAPKRESYDLAKLQQGEVRVYRPVGMVEYLGSTLNVDVPDLETFVT